MRVVCRAHWLSDTTRGRTIASATFPRLQSDPTFKASSNWRGSKWLARTPNRGQSLISCPRSLD